MWVRRATRFPQLHTAFNGAYALTGRGRGVPPKGAVSRRGRARHFTARKPPFGQ